MVKLNFSRFDDKQLNVYLYQQGIGRLELWKVERQVGVSIFPFPTFLF